MDQRESFRLNECGTNAGVRIFFCAKDGKQKDLIVYSVLLVNAQKAADANGSRLVFVDFV